MPIPILNVLMMWAASRNRARYTPFMLKLWRFTLWTAPAVSVAFIVAAMLEKPYQP